MFRPALTLLAAALLLGACSTPDDAAPAADAAPDAAATSAEASPAISADNPLLRRSDLLLQAPPFDKIDDADFLPAYRHAMAEQLAEVEAIAGNEAAPTFENTLVALEKSGQALRRVDAVFGILSSANTNDTIQATKEAIAPELAAHADAIFLNAALYQRLQAVAAQRDTMNLDPESARLLDWQLQQFKHAGAQLPAADKARLKELNEDISRLSAQFENKLLGAIKDGALTITDEGQLSGLSSGDRAAAHAAARDRGVEGAWVLVLQNTTQQPALAELESRDVRKTLFEHSWNRAERGDDNDTRATITRMAQLRAEKARLLGFDNFASWKLEDQMAKTPAAVFDFVRALVEPTNARARTEAAELQEMIRADGDDFQVQPWDWEYYAQKVRAAKYDLDEAAVKPYFELDKVLRDGVFYAAGQVYGLSFKERTDLPVWQEDVRVFEVHDADDSLLGLFYADFYKRDNKGGGAWMSNLVEQSRLLGTQPVIYNVCNFTKPAPGQPALISWDDVITMFHEFGHALHGFFADQQYVSLSGTNTARDWVEFPSQFNEHWASEPSIFKHYAVHYETGEPMPQELVDKLAKARNFNQGYALGELLSAALLDMSWHTLPADAPAQDVDDFEARALKDNGTDLPFLPPRYRSSYFQHIWGHGYSAGYYAYLWTEMLDDDAWSWFTENGGLSRANGDRFRQMILSRGNTEDLAQMYRDFRGRDPNVKAMLHARGLD